MNILQAVGFIQIPAITVMRRFPCFVAHPSGTAAVKKMFTTLENISFSNLYKKKSTAQLLLHVFNRKVQLFTTMKLAV